MKIIVRAGRNTADDDTTSGGVGDLPQACGNMPLQVIGDRRFPSRVLLLLLFLLLSGLFAVTVATYGVERELYLPVELFHPLFVP